MAILNLRPGHEYKVREFGNAFMYGVVCLKADDDVATIQFKDGGMVDIRPWSAVTRERDVLVFGEMQTVPCGCVVM